MNSPLATRFSYGSSRVVRSDEPLSNETMFKVAPSIFAADKHCSRSQRYTYLPTIAVVEALRKEGFQPFMVAQGLSRIEGKTPYTKHMLRMRHASQAREQGEANEVILINSHDGTSAFQLLAGRFRFVCQNGLVCGEILDDIRVKHKGNVQDQVVAGAYQVLDGFTRVVEEVDVMKQLPMSVEEQVIFAETALSLRYEVDEATGRVKSPIDPRQAIQMRRIEDSGDSLWLAFQRLQENLTRGGQPGQTRTADNKVRNVTTRPVNSIDSNVKLNRALWVLAERMGQLKGADIGRSHELEAATA
jgi:hypothetical protein